MAATTGEVRFVRMEVRAADSAVAERAAGEAWHAGIVGLEEREAPEGAVLLLLYAPAARGEAVRNALVNALGAAAEVTQPRPEPEVDWSVLWRTGLEAVEISPRLVVRPPFVSFALRPGQACVVVEPGQAFGTGGHASTRLALELLESVEAERVEGARVLDVGCGSGVLALAALALGAGSAVGFDTDPLAAHAAVTNGRANHCGGRFAVLIGSLDALTGPPFDLVLVNLLRGELLPLAPGLARLLRAGGTLIASGLLVSEETEVGARFRATGLRLVAERSLRDPGGEHWLGLVMRR
jgi:ribosomal protein L11 methyltransferase